MSLDKGMRIAHKSQEKGGCRNYKSTFNTMPTVNKVRHEPFKSQIILELWYNIYWATTQG